MVVTAMNAELICLPVFFCLCCCVPLADDPALSSDWDLEEAVAGMAAVSNLLARKLDRGGK